MKRQLVSIRKSVTLLAVLMLTLSACGSSSESESTDENTKAQGSSDGSESDGAVFEQLDLSGIEITVASKDFTEQVLLGEMLAQSFEAAGAMVTNQVDLGGTVVNRDALLAGEIDTYAEYNGTGWTVHLEKGYEEVVNDEGIVEPEALTEAVREADLEANDIKWVGRTPFNNTYGFASSPELLDDGSPFNFNSMAAYLKANPDAIVCMESEFPSRPDGLVLFEKATGYELPESQSKILDTGIIYTETESGECDFGEIFTTDGRIDGLGLNLVDDKGAMIIYNASITMPNSVYEAAPEAFDQIAADIFAPLDNETMTELNRQVDIDGIPAEEVAATFLQEQGLIST